MEKGEKPFNAVEFPIEEDFIANFQKHPKGNTQT